MPKVWRSRSHPAGLPQGSQSRFGARASTAIMFGAVDKVSAVVGRDAAVGLTGVVVAVETTQQRVELLPL